MNGVIWVIGVNGVIGVILVIGVNWVNGGEWGDLGENRNFMNTWSQQEQEQLHESSANWLRM